MEKEVNGIIKLLRIVRNYMNINDSDVSMSTFNSTKEVIDVIDKHIERLLESDISKINDLIVMFLPTSDFQEISIRNDWGEEYLKIAEAFDDLIKLIKKKK